MVVQLGIRLDTTQQLRLVLTPELKQTIRILQYSALELEEYLHEQLTKNPLFEVEYGSHPTYRHHQEDTGPIWERLATNRPSWVEKLEAQLISFSLTPTQEELCRYLIGSLDERGYLDVEQEEVRERFSVSQEDWEICLHVLQSLEPAGIGARSLAECLVIQLKRKKCSPLALHLVEQHLEELAMKQWESLKERLQVDQQQLDEALKAIRECDPEPARQLQTDSPVYLIPDVIVKQTDEGITIQYNDDWLPKIRIQPEYQQLYGSNPEAYRYFRPWMKSARVLLKGLNQRRETMLRVTAAILEYQDGFLQHGVQSVKPLTLRQIAEKCDLHESTISRATQGKYLQTPHGLFPFRFFFPSGVPDRFGHRVSVRKVKELIQQLIQQESKQQPLSDQQIAQILREQEGLHISRRTVNKYRQELGIPSSVKRKKLAIGSSSFSPL